MTKIIRILLIISLMLSSQAHAFGISWSNNKVKEIMVKTGPRSNQDFALPIDIVFVMDEELVKNKTFSDLSNQIYYQDRNMLHMQYAGSIVHLEIELPPLHLINEVTLPKGHKKAYQLLVFTNFMDKSEQPMPVDISKIKEPLIDITGLSLDISAR
jgi:hypothetical protein